MRKIESSFLFILKENLGCICLFLSYYFLHYNCTQDQLPITDRFLRVSCHAHKN